jgi:hypothetical protein
MLMDDKNHGEHYKKIFKDREPIWSSEDDGDEGMFIGQGSDSDRSLSPEPYLIHHGPNDSLFIPHPPDDDDLTDEEDDEEDDEGEDEEEDGKKKKKPNPQDPKHVLAGVTVTERFLIRELLRKKANNPSLLTRDETKKLDDTNNQGVVMQEQTLMEDSDIECILVRNDHYL